MRKICGLQVKMLMASIVFCFGLKIGLVGRFSAVEDPGCRGVALPSLPRLLGRA